MERQVGDLRQLWSGETERIALRATFAYRRMLDDLARILTGCRRRQGLRIEAIAEQTGLPVRRLQAFEKGALAASWPEILLMAPAYRTVLSTVTRRLHGQFVRSAGEDAHRIEAYLQCCLARAPELTNAERERVNQMLSSPLNPKFIDVTIADWPSCLPPGLPTLLRVERDMIVAQMKGLNGCMARVSAEGAGGFVDLCGIHQSLIIIATSLEWQLKRHCPRLGDESRSSRRGEAIAEEATMRCVGEGIVKCRAIVLDAVSNLDPFVGSGAGWGDGCSSPVVGEPASPPSVHLIRSPALEFALSYSVLRLGNAATRLVELRKALS